MTRTIDSFDGDRIYVDAVLLVGLADSASPWNGPSRRFFRRVADGAVSAVTAALTIDEATIVLLQELVARPPFSVGRSRTQYLGAHPETVRTLMQALDDPLHSLTTLLTLESVLPDDIAEMRREILASGTLPRDAIHVAVMRRLGITAIATDDEGFERCAGITVYRP